MPDRHIGLLTPPANANVEPEVASLLPAGCSLHTARLPVLEGDLEARMHGYNDHLEDTARRFGSLHLDAIYYACTGSSYVHGRDQEAALLGTLKRVHPDAIAVTAADAVVQAFQSMGRTRMLLLSAYPEWLTDAAITYWSDAGLDVQAVRKIPSPNGLYNVSTRDIEDAAADLSPTPNDVLMISGTGVPTVPAIRVLAERLRIPAVSPNICAARLLADGGASALDTYVLPTTSATTTL